MFNTIKNTTKAATRFTSTKDTISYTIKTLQLRAEKERLEKIQKSLKDREQKELVEDEIDRIEKMMSVYKDAAKRAFESALD